MSFSYFAFRKVFQFKKLKNCIDTNLSEPSIYGSSRRPISAAC